MNDMNKNSKAAKAIPFSSDTTDNDITSFFECPVCFDYVLPPIYQCRSGHLVCASCRVNLKFCPTCRGPLGNIRNLAMEKVASTIFFPCKFNNSGCNKSLSHTEKLEHEEICEFRPYVCPCPGASCKWQGSLEQVMSHLLVSHKTITTLQGEDIVFLATDINLPGNVDWVMMQSCFGHYFILVLEKQEKQLLLPNTPTTNNISGSGNGYMGPGGSPSNGSNNSANNTATINPLGGPANNLSGGLLPLTPNNNGNNIGNNSVNLSSGGTLGSHGHSVGASGNDISGHHHLNQHNLQQTSPQPLQQFYAVVQLIGSRRQAENFAYKLELNGNGRRLTWETRPRSVHEGVSSAIARSDCLVFESGVAALFAENGNLAINVTITSLLQHNANNGGAANLTSSNSSQNNATNMIGNNSNSMSNNGGGMGNNQGNSLGVGSGGGTNFLGLNSSNTASGGNHCSQQHIHTCLNNLVSNNANNGIGGGLLHTPNAAVSSNLFLLNNNNANSSHCAHGNTINTTNGTNNNLCCLNSGGHPSGNVLQFGMSHGSVTGLHNHHHVNLQTQASTGAGSIGNLSPNANLL